MPHEINIVDAPYDEIVGEFDWDCHQAWDALDEVSRRHGVSRERLDLQLAQCIPDARTPRQSIERAAQNVAERDMQATTTQAMNERIKATGRPCPIEQPPENQIIGVYPITTLLGFEYFAVGVFESMERGFIRVGGFGQSSSYEEAARKGHQHAARRGVVFRPGVMRPSDDDRWLASE